MTLNQAGIDLIKQFEGCRLTSYPDPASGGDPWTIGYGSTGPNIGPNMVWTQEQADTALVSHLNSICGTIKSHITTEPNDNQFSAIVSLVYNIGIGNFIGHDLLKYVNLGDMDSAANEFEKWDKAAGKVMSGLLKRRQAEKALFLTV